MIASLIILGLLCYIPIAFVTGLLADFVTDVDQDPAMFIGFLWPISLPILLIGFVIQLVAMVIKSF